MIQPIKNMELNKIAKKLRFGRYAVLFGLVAPLYAATVELGDPSLSTDPDSPSKLAVSMNSTISIVGLQFDLVYSSDLASPGIPSLPKGSDHTIDVRLVEAGRYRVMVFSPTNKELTSPFPIDLRFGFADAAPNGGPAMRLENLILAGSDGTSIPAAPTYGPIGSWRNEKFSDAVWNNKTTGGDTGDADGDGYANIQEFYFDTDPRKSNSNASNVVNAQLVPAEAGGNKVLRLSWTGRKSDRGVMPVVYGGTNPASLTEPVSSVVVGSSSDPDLDQLKAEKSVNGASAYFLELRVERE